MLIEYAVLYLYCGLFFMIVGSYWTGQKSKRSEESSWVTSSGRKRWFKG